MAYLDKKNDLAIWGPETAEDEKIMSQLLDSLSYAPTPVDSMASFLVDAANRRGSSYEEPAYLELFTGSTDYVTSAHENIDKLILGTMMEKPSLTGSTYYDALSKQDEGSVVSALIDYLFGRGKNVQP